MSDFLLRKKESWNKWNLASLLGCLSKASCWTHHTYMNSDINTQTHTLTNTNTHIYIYIYIYIKYESICSSPSEGSPVNWSWNYRIRHLSLPKGRTNPHMCLRYNIKQSDGETPVLELLWVWCSSSLPLFPDPLWLEMLVPIRVLSIRQIELLNHSL